MSGGTYEVAAGPARAELRDRGSLFRALVVPVADESQARRTLSELEDEHRDATHVCWAWRIGHPALERCSDAGEPSGTAGPPILAALRGAGLTDALVAVVRWYGGVNLGRGGLVRAYGGAARAALDEAPRSVRVPTAELRVRLPAARAGAVKRLVRPPGVELVSQDFSQEALLVLRVQEPQLESVLGHLADLGAVVDRL